MSEKNKHLTEEDRVTIERLLSKRTSLRQIAKEIGKDPKTISNEIKKYRKERNIVSAGRHFNNCLNRMTCNLQNLACDTCTVNKIKLCKFCSKCRLECDNYIEDECTKLTKPPYVCNGCDNYSKCIITKQFYYSHIAHKAYKETLSISRSGVTITEADIERLNNLLYPLIVENGQSIHHIYINHADEIMMCEKSLYKLIDSGLLKVRNIDLQKKVKRRQRKSKSSFKVDKNCYIDRTYNDFKIFIKNNPDIAIVEMDTVEGVKGESCILTIHFTVSSFMIACKREYNDAKSVVDFFDKIYEDLGRDAFMKLFPVILTDRGSEFSNPKAIEFDKQGNRRTYVFYCDPSAPFQKGSCEVNHELIRYVVPKGKSFNPYNQKDINLLMSHVNSYVRDKLNDKTPLFMFSNLFSKEVAAYFGIEYIHPDAVKLKPSLLAKGK